MAQSWQPNHKPKNVHIDNQEAETTVTRPSELRLGTADFAQGLATCSMNGVDMDGVILRNVSSMKSLCGSPKTPTFKSSKSKKKISNFNNPPNEKMPKQKAMFTTTPTTVEAEKMSRQEAMPKKKAETVIVAGPKQFKDKTVHRHHLHRQGGQVQHQEGAHHHLPQKEGAA